MTLGDFILCGAATVATIAAMVGVAAYRVRNDERWAHLARNLEGSSTAVLIICVVVIGIAFIVKGNGS